MRCFHIEPGLADALSDPIVQALMTADGVDARALEDELQKAARRINEYDAIGSGGLCRL